MEQCYNHWFFITLLVYLSSWSSNHLNSPIGLIAITNHLIIYVSYLPFPLKFTFIDASFVLIIACHGWWNECSENKVSFLLYHVFWRCLILLLLSHFIWLYYYIVLAAVLLRFVLLGTHTLWAKVGKKKEVNYLLLNYLYTIYWKWY